MSNWIELGDRIPVGTSGRWSVERRVDRSLTEPAFDGVELALTVLARDGQVVMSNHPNEVAEHAEPIRQARRRGGRVLVHGLGLGLIAAALLELENVEHVDVVELEPDVIKLVASALDAHERSGRLTVHHADCRAMRWPAQARWSVIWHDIWPAKNDVNLDEMHRLQAAFVDRCDWQGCWSGDDIELYLLRRGQAVAQMWMS